MNIRVDERGASRVAVVSGAHIVDEQGAKDVLADVGFTYGCNKLIIPKECFSEAFFDLKTGLLGAALQKFVTYHMVLAIVGDFSQYTSKSFRDFMFESNNGRHVFFLATEQEALDALHAREI